MPTIDFATRYSTRYSDFLLQPFSNPTGSKKSLLVCAWWYTDALLRYGETDQLTDGPTNQLTGEGSKYTCVSNKTLSIESSVKHIPVTKRFLFLSLVDYIWDCCGFALSSTITFAATRTLGVKVFPGVNDATRVGCWCGPIIVLGLGSR